MKDMEPNRKISNYFHQYICFQ